MNSWGDTCIKDLSGMDLIGWRIKPHSGNLISWLQEKGEMEGAADFCKERSVLSLLQVPLIKTYLL